mgnify:CR=1 FL=1
MKNLQLLIKIAWRNCGRQRRRTIITVGAMAIGLALCIPTYGLVEGLNRQMVATITQSHLGHVQIHHPEYMEERRFSMAFRERQIASIVRSDPAVQAASPRVYTGGMVSFEQQVKTRLQAVSIHEKVKSGHLPKNACETAIDARLAHNWRIEIGTILRPSPLPPEPACEQLIVTGILPASHDEYRVILREQDFTHFQTPANATTSPSIDDIDQLKRLEAPHFPDASNVTMHPPSNVTTSVRSWSLIRSTSAQTAIIAVDPQQERLVTNMHRKVTAGTYLGAYYKEKNDELPEILLGDSLARQLMVQPKDLIGLDIMTAQGFPVDVRMRVAGVFDSGIDSLDRTLAFVHIGLAWDPDVVDLREPRSGAPHVHEIAVRLYDGSSESAAAARLSLALLPWKLQVWPWQKLEPSLASMLKIQDAVVAILLLIIFTIAALGTMNTMLMAVFERVREFGVLKAIGMRPSFVFSLILIETFFMSLLATITGGIPGFFINHYLSIYGLNFSSLIPGGYRYQGILLDPIWHTALTLKSVIVPIAILTTVSCIVAIWPALRAARIRPVKAFRQEGV